MRFEAHADEVAVLDGYCSVTGNKSRADFRCAQCKEKQNERIAAKTVLSCTDSQDVKTAPSTSL